MSNLLLTTVCRPFGGKGEGDSVGAELFHAQVTRSQGIFSYGQVGPRLYRRKHRGAKLDDLYHGLRSRGVAILTSMIIGFPYQDQKQVQSEFKQLMDLAPDLWQILIYFAFPGTPLCKKVLEEGRYLSAYREQPDYRKFDGFSMHFKHEHFNPKEIEDLQKALYRKAFETLGPSLVRAIKTWFEGYLIMKSSSFKKRLECWGTLPFSFWTWMTESLGWFQQPGLFRREHRV